MNSIWRRANYKNKPKYSPHLVKISKRNFYDIYNNTSMIIKEVTFLDNNVTKVLAEIPESLIKNLSKKKINNSGIKSVLLYLNGYEIGHYLTGLLSSDKNIYLKYKFSDKTFSVKINYFIINVRKVALVREVNTPINVINTFDEVMRDMNIIDKDGDLLKEKINA